MEHQNVSRLSRRTFLFAGFVAAVGRATTYAQQPAQIPETLTQWLAASAKMRKLALQRCLDRIQTMEPSIHAWVQVSPQRNTTRGRLSGIPYGVKDIIETRGLATEYGSPIYKGRIGTTDAAIIREMRKHGAILLGKTQTTAFAYLTPAPTRNPRDLEHTPGGSSSGSATAVAAGMVPFAIGEQTRGSVLRPASFCGVTGFKPTYDLLSMEGVLPLSKSLDTLGFFTHTPADMSALGIHWVIPWATPKILISEHQSPFPVSNQRWRRHIRTLFHVCATPAHRSDRLISPERSLSLPRQT
jgi:Asp-tRNA(Asn)/Glu-tRNA(Gln) amidotransferase A subunit family amidase